jgi:hypothetical protein
MAEIIIANWRNGYAKWPAGAGCQTLSANCSTSRAGMSGEPITYSGGLDG